MNSTYSSLPAEGQPITVAANGKLIVPERPIILFIEGDGIGPEIMRAAMTVWEAAVTEAYSGSRSVQWKEAYAGAKANEIYGGQVRLPSETIEAIRKYRVAVKGPLTTPIATGINSLNVALRQALDLYVCLRPFHWFKGVPTPLKHPEWTNMVVFRENTEDIYAGIEWRAGTPEVTRLIEFLSSQMGVKKICFPQTTGIGIKPVSKEASQRLIRAAIRYAYANHMPTVTLIHKGNIMKFTEGAFRNWGCELVRNELKDIAVLSEDCGGKKIKGKILVNDFLADAFFQQILMRPKDFSVIATLNLNGDYLSDALAACVGGIGLAPGANINFESQVALFEATHGTAPKYAGQDKVNPSSLILSGEMMFRHIGWLEAADVILRGIKRTLENRTVTYDLHRLMKGARLLSCTQFTEAVVSNMQ